jgi:acyl-CoA synthetase (AMP-forming)/AMP-acid ligase II
MNIIESPYDEVELAALPLPAYLLSVLPDPDRPALVDGLTGTTVSYGELSRTVWATASGLVARGLGKGDVLALASPNCAEFVIAYLAALAAGAVVTMINPQSPPADIVRQLDQAGARWIVTIPRLAPISTPRVRETFVFGPGDGEGSTPFAALAATGEPVPLPVIHPDDGALLLYSSGTTGLPKGVPLSHRNLVASLCQMHAVHRVRLDDVVFAVLPLHHVFGLQVSLALGLRAGATVVTIGRFDLADFLRVIQDRRVTRTEIVPPIVLGLARHPAVPDYDLSSLRVIMSGGAPLDGGLAAECERRLGCLVKQGYGMTEFAGATHLAPDTGDGDRGSIGPALPGVQCRMIDCATGLDVAAGQPGELLIRTPAATRGYLGDAEATAATIDADGWLHTGDIVTADRAGWFTVVDRLKELIKYKAHQVAPAALEGILLGHPAVADAAVIGVPDEEAGEIPAAFVVPTVPGGGDAAELIRFVADRVAPHERIRRVEFVDAIPKSPSGKILRRLLKATVPV